MSAATILFAWATMIFAILWIAALAAVRRRAEKHLQAIMFALEALPWSAVRSFLRCYVDGRHDVIARDFPHFAEYCRQQDIES